MNIIELKFGFFYKEIKLDKNKKSITFSNQNGYNDCYFGYCFSEDPLDVNDLKKMFTMKNIKRISDGLKITVVNSNNYQYMYVVYLGDLYAEYGDGKEKWRPLPSMLEK